MERLMTLEALGLGAGRVRVQISSLDAVMNVDLDRKSAVDHAAAVLQQAGVTLIRVDRDGGYRVEAVDAAGRAVDELGTPVAECSYCTTRITLLGGSWTADDGTTCCTDQSAPYVPHKPKGA